MFLNPIPKESEMSLEDINFNNVNSWISFFGSIASIIGLFLTYKVWLGMKNLRRFYVSKATVPQQIQQLSSLREQISDNLSGRYSNENKEKIKEILAEVSVNVDNLAPKVRDFDKSQYKTSIEPKIKSFKQGYVEFKSDSGKENARNAGLSLFEVIRATELLMEDDSWRRIQ